MKNEIKKIFSIIAAFFAGIAAFIIRAKICDNRNTTDSNRIRIDECKRRAEQQQRDNREAIEGIEGTLATISEIRKNQKYIEDSDCLDKWYCNSIAGDNDLGAE